MTDYYLAIDIGASSGRHILGHMEKEKMVIEEIHRFDNGIIIKDNHWYWDLDRLFSEILIGMEKCNDLGKVPKSMGIDTWGVDYVLLDAAGNLMGESYAYRDLRTQDMDLKVGQVISESELYLRTGIQKQPFNTIYQLMALKESNPEHMERASHFLMIPDYFHYLLTGVMKNEYTNGTTTQLIDPRTKDWDYDLISRLGYNVKMFGEILKPGTPIGELTSEIQEVVGYSCKVILPATHDTASAVVAVPFVNEESLYLSSGTWSLMGIERVEADCSMSSCNLNFTNEGGYNSRYRFLKNIMGLWMIQSLKKELEEPLTYEELCLLASEANIDSIVDCNDSRFIAPESMHLAITKLCLETKQQLPQTPGEFAEVIYRSLAHTYKSVVEELEGVTKQTFGTLHIVGGGASATYLNQLTADVTGKQVLAGPIEATAIGNIGAQMIASGIFNHITEVRKCIYNSFQMEKFKGGL